MTEIMDYPIEELELGVRAYNVLKRMGVYTFGDLLAVTGQDVATWEKDNESAYFSRKMGYTAWEQIVRAKVNIENMAK
jgi:hypothetical protein